MKEKEESIHPLQQRSDENEDEWIQRLCSIAIEEKKEEEVVTGYFQYCDDNEAWEWIQRMHPTDEPSPSQRALDFVSLSLFGRNIFESIERDANAPRRRKRQRYKQKKRKQKMDSLT